MNARQMVLTSALTAVVGAEANAYLRTQSFPFEPIAAGLVYVIVGSVAATAAPTVTYGFATVVLITALLSGPWNELAGRL